MKTLYILILILFSPFIQAVTQVEMEQFKSGHWGINVVINDTISYPFIIDTGAQGAIIPSALVEHLGFDISKLQDMRVRGAVGERSVKQLTLKSMKIGEKTVENVHGIVVDLPMLSSSGKVPGVLPYTVLNQFMPEFDLVTKQLKLHDKSSISLSKQQDLFTRIPIKLVQGSFIKFNLTINDQQISATLDSGAAKRVDINWQAANLIGITHDDTNLSIGDPIRGASGESLQTKLSPPISLGVDKVNFASRSVNISDMPVLKVLHGDKPAANVGIGLFENRRLIIDYQNQQLLVSKLST